MKKSLFSLLAALTLTVGTALAQTTPATDQNREARGERMNQTPEERATRESERMTKELGLNPDQAARIKSINMSRDEEMRANRGQMRDEANRDQMREQMQASRARYDAQYKEVLTADQYTKYAAMQNNRGRRGDDDAKVKMKDNKTKVKADGKGKMKTKRS